MITRTLRGTTAELNALNLPAGHLAVDEERNALRYYDGETQGGFEALGQQAYEPPPPPGPQELLHGTEEQGFYGEVPAEDFINGVELASQIGLSQGTVQHTTEPWLKFASQGQVLYVAKKPLRHTVSWDAIYQTGAVYGDDTEGRYPTGTPRLQDARVVLDGITYRVRLLTGGDGDPTTSAGGEWNQLLYPVHVDDPDQLGWGVNYTDADLVVASGNGRASWVQETLASNTNNRVRRGYSSLSGFTPSPSSNASTNFGWRPVLVPEV